MKTQKDISPQFVRATEGIKETSLKSYSTGKQGGFKDGVRKSVTDLAYRLSKSCYEGDDSRINIERFLTGITKIRGAYYAK